MNIAEIVAAAFGQAVEGAGHVAGNDDKGPIHRQRSQRFVALLARALRGAHEDPNIEVMSMHLFEDDSDSVRQVRKQFGMQELLFDIVVFQKGETITNGGEILSYVRKGLWIVESELAKDSRQALHDFNKLVLGSSVNKLFVGPLVAPSERGGYLNALRAAAIECEGNLYVALIPHPETWEDEHRRGTENLVWGDGDWHGNLGPFG